MAPTRNVQYVPDTEAGLLAIETCESDGTDDPGLLIVSVRQVGPEFTDEPVSVIEVTQEDPDSCEVVLSETGARDGQKLRLFNMSAQPLVIRDLPGIHDLAGDFTMGQNDHIVLRYNRDRWVELSRQEN